MDHDDRSDVPVRSPVDVRTAEVASTQDENDFSTLLHIQSEINREMANLSSIDVFELDNGQISIENQIIAYRKAKEILEPIQATINSTVDSIKLKQKGEANGAK